MTLLLLATFASFARSGGDDYRLRDVPGTDGAWQEGQVVVPAPWEKVQGWLTDYDRWAQRFPDIAWAERRPDDERGRHVVRFHSRSGGRTFVLHEEVRPHRLVFVAVAPHIQTQGRIWILAHGPSQSRVIIQTTTEVHGMAGWFATRGYKRKRAFAGIRSQLAALLHLARPR